MAPTRRTPRTAKTLDPAALLRLTARDLMKSPIVSVSPDDSIDHALSCFEEYGISLLPVVDDSGKTVGMLSKADVARTDHLRDGRLDGRPGDGTFAGGARMAEEDDLPDFPARDDYSPEVLGPTRVADWMHPDVVFVMASTDVRELCRVMIEEGVHHLLVMEKNRFVGLLSSLDVVRAVAECGHAS